MFRILIAEDDKELRQLFQHVLMKNGYAVTGVADGKEALDAIDKGYYDLIISDIMMPVMDGYELAGLPRWGWCRKYPRTWAHRLSLPESRRRDCRCPGASRSIPPGSSCG